MGSVRPEVQPYALVMNCNYNGLALIQSLGRRGVPVFAVDSRRSIGTRSRYAEYLKVPDPGIDRHGFIDSLVNLGERFQNKPIIFPTNDQWAEALAWGASQLSDYYCLCVADLSTVELLLDKERFGRWAMANNIQVPQLWSSSEAAADPADLVYPVAVKANSRRRAGQDRGLTIRTRDADRLRFVPCSSAGELADALALAEATNIDVFCQEVVRGRSDAMRTIGVYANRGHVLGLLYGRKIRGFPAQHGDCIVGQAEPTPEWARSLAVRCCGLLEYTGIAELEVMIDSRSGKHQLIEINPRSWSWVGVGPAAGVDLGWIAYQDMVQGIRPKHTVVGCPDGQPVYYAKVLEDFQNSLIWYRFDDAPDWVQGPIAWWRYYAGGKGVFAEFAWDDPRVAWYSLVRFMRQFVEKSVAYIRQSKPD